MDLDFKNSFGGGASSLIGFTLAEVLIVLGIIGVVAALTMPSLISNYKKKVVETRLRQTYSIFNQAIKLSEIKNGESSTWILPTVSYGDSDKIKLFLSTYIVPYLSSYKDFNTNANYVRLYLNNGIYTYWAYNTGSFEVYVRFSKPKRTDGNAFLEGNGGVDYFVFYMRTYASDFVPFNHGYTIEYLTNSGSGNDCRDTGYVSVHASCAEFIMQNGWHIPKNYPLKF